MKKADVQLALAYIRPQYSAATISNQSDHGFLLSTYAGVNCIDNESNKRD